MSNQNKKNDRGNRNKTFKNPVIPQALTWSCVACNFILGYTDSSREELRMKYKDQYIIINNARSVQSTCRRCGKLNTVHSLQSE